MKNRLCRVSIPLLIALCDPASAQGFRGLHWGANVAAVKRVFPLVTEERDTGELIAPCVNADSSTYKCSVAQRRGCPGFCVNGFSFSSATSGLQIEW
jgi:hypothetical protein